MFDSFNPYHNMIVLRANEPEELIEMIKQIKTPIKIVQIVAANNRHYAYLMGDIRVQKKKKNLNKGE